MSDEVKEVRTINGQPLQIKVSRGPGGRYDFDVSLYGSDPIQTMEAVKTIIEQLNLIYPFAEKGKLEKKA